MNLIFKVSKFLLERILKTYIINVIIFKIKINKLLLDQKIENINPTKLKYKHFLNQYSSNFSKQKLYLIKERLDSGNYVAYGEIVDGKLVYSTWISFKETNVPITNEKYILSNSEAVLEDSFCHKDYRGRGLHSKYNLFRLKKILEYGRIYAFVFVFSENIYAINTQKKSGLKEFFNFKVGKIFGFPFSTFRQNFNSNTFFNK